MTEQHSHDPAEVIRDVVRVEFAHLRGEVDRIEVALSQQAAARLMEQHKADQAESMWRWVIGAAAVFLLGVMASLMMQTRDQQATVGMIATRQTANVATLAEVRANQNEILANQVRIIQLLNPPETSEENSN